LLWPIEIAVDGQLTAAPDRPTRKGQREPGKSEFLRRRAGSGRFAAALNVMKEASLGGPPAVPDKTAGASWLWKRAVLRYNSIVYAIDIRTGRLRVRSQSTTDLTVCACGPVRPLPAGHTGVLR
jgi:hypothetical protein